MFHPLRRQRTYEARKMLTTPKGPPFCCYCLLLLSASLWVCAECAPADALQTPIQYFFGEDMFLSYAGELSALFVAIVMLAVGLEYLLQLLKEDSGTYFRIVSSSVNQELLIASMTTLMMKGVVASIPLPDLFLTLIEDALLGLLFMVGAFIALILVITGLLVWSRRSWRLFERTKMTLDLEESHEEVRASHRALEKRGVTSTQPTNNDEETVEGDAVLRPEDDEDDESAGPSIRFAVTGESPATTPSQATEAVPKKEETSAQGVPQTPAPLPSARRRKRRVIGGNARMMTDFSYQEKIYTRCRDLYVETLVRKGLWMRGKDEIAFTEYVWRLMPEIVALVADLSWKAWMVLALGVIVDGVRAVIVLGDNTDISDTVLVTGISSFIIVGGFFPLAGFLLLHFVLQSTLEKLSQKPLMRRKERENQAKMARPSENLFFRSLTTTTHIFQIVLLLFEWYIAFFFITFAKITYSQLGQLCVMVYVAAVIPIAVFLWFVPWTLTVITIMSGLGEDLRPEIVHEIRDRLRMARGALTSYAIRELEEYSSNLPGEWNGQTALHLNREGADGRRESSPCVPQIVAPYEGTSKSRPMPQKGSRAIAEHRVVVRPPAAVLDPIIPSNFVLPHERAYFDQFDDRRVAETDSDDDL